MGDRENNSSGVERNVSQNRNIFEKTFLVSELEDFITAYDIFNGTLFKNNLLREFQEFINKNLTNIDEIKKNEPELFKRTVELISKFNEQNTSDSQIIMEEYRDQYIEFLKGNTKVSIMQLISRNDELMNEKSKLLNIINNHADSINTLFLYIREENYMLMNKDFVYRIYITIDSQISNTYNYILKDLFNDKRVTENKETFDLYQQIATYWNRFIQSISKQMRSRLGGNFDYYIPIVGGDIEIDG